MFRSSNKLPQRKCFNFSLAEIEEDIQNVSKDADQRAQLYVCIDDKVPQADVKFSKIEEFLQGSDNLESVGEQLNDLCDELSALEKQLVSGASQIKDLVADVIQKTKVE